MEENKKSLEEKKKAIIDGQMSCVCIEAYAKRDMADPECPKCSGYAEILDCMEEYLTAYKEALKSEIFKKSGLLQEDRLEMYLLIDETK